MTDKFEIEKLKEFPKIEELESVELIIFRKKDKSLILTKFLNENE